MSSANTSEESCVVLARKQILSGVFIGRMPAHERTQVRECATADQRKMQVRECATAGQKNLQIFQGQASPPGSGFHKEKNNEFR